MCEGLNVRRSIKGRCLEFVVGFAVPGIKEITIKVYIPLIYIVNSSLKSKYYKI